MGPSLRSLARRARVSPVRFSLVAATATLLIGATAYLGTASILWYRSVSDLREVTTDLEGSLASRESTNRDQADQIVTLTESLATAQADLITEAHRKALMQDDQIVYREVASALKDCADERVNVVTTVQNRRNYILWTVHSYDDSVTLVCDPVVSALHEQMVGESK
jgi:hypothetical protein